MARATIDPAIAAHLEWLGFVRPTGLVVSATALQRAGAILERRDAEGQRLLRASVTGVPSDTDVARERPYSYDGRASVAETLPEFTVFARQVFGWSFSPKAYVGTEAAPIPSELEVALPDLGETLRPDYAVRELEPRAGESSWQLLVNLCDRDADFDRATRTRGGFEVSPNGRMERQLRALRVPAGLLVNGHAVRLVSAPRGESSGWLDFRLADMLQTAGRPICTALRLLLNEQRLLALPRQERLTNLLVESRRYQNEVSERLAQQVMHAMYEFVRGFQSAHDYSRGELLRGALARTDDTVYHGLLTVVLRLVFLLYAEERDLLPGGDVFLRHYSLGGLHQRLREDAALHPDTLDQRYGAWAQLLVLFRLIHDGADAGDLRLPRRHGLLFDPDRFPFLEGRTQGTARQITERLRVPLVSDGTLHRVLEKLLVLDGERISYRALDVEQIGSVYETMMGFKLGPTTGPTVAIRAPKTWGAPTAVDLEELKAVEPSKREKWFEEQTDRALGKAAKKDIAAATTIDALHAALHSLVDLDATPDRLPPGALVPRPSDARRRSGTDYTPRTLTEPIVRTALEPILARLRGVDGRSSRANALLELKICDPAMGSGAFLVEVCRQLGDALVEAWHTHDEVPAIPPDEREEVYAMRLVAQRCLYGVDRNPMAADLAKVSLWLATLAKEHALTFVDHALRHGDSLVGLSRRQIEALHWDPSQPVLKGLGVHEALEQVATLRREIREAGDDVPYGELRRLLDDADSALSRVCLFGDLVVSAFFEGENAKERKAALARYQGAIAKGEADRFRDEVRERRYAEPALAPFHWEIEFPEVFERAEPGFDVFVGNPPFAGKNTIAAGNVEHYSDWLQQTHAESHGNADLVAHFFRRVFDRLRRGGALGLIATNTIAQGDTRGSGLRWICEHGGEVYRARRRVRWPGRAAVVVSVVHLSKGTVAVPRVLDGKPVDSITAFLFHRGGHADPARLVANASKSFVGSYVLGMGFTFDDTDSKGVASPLSEMHRLIAKDPRNREAISPYIGAEEVNNSPTHAHHRYVINFGEHDEAECRRIWPDLMAIVEERVKPERIAHKKNSVDRARAQYWWMFGSSARELRHSLQGTREVIVTASSAAEHHLMTVLKSLNVFSHKLIVVVAEREGMFAVLQSRVHEIWSRMFGTTRGAADDLTYNPTRVFQTFPFPNDGRSDAAMAAVGQSYRDFRAALMVANDEGLTTTYNRFHDPNEVDPQIVELRRLHAEMDKAVLAAYGWIDIDTACCFFLDYEIDEETWGAKRKPYRLRWPDDVRDDVLARLLELNAERARQERRSGATAATKPKKKRATQKKKGSSETLFP